MKKILICLLALFSAQSFASPATDPSLLKSLQEAITTSKDECTNMIAQEKEFIASYYDSQGLKSVESQHRALKSQHTALQNRYMNLTAQTFFIAKDTSLNEFLSHISGSARSGKVSTWISATKLANCLDEEVRKTNTDFYSLK